MIKPGYRHHASIGDPLRQSAGIYLTCGNAVRPLPRRSLRPVQDKCRYGNQRKDITDVCLKVRPEKVDCSPRTRACADRSSERTAELVVVVHRRIAAAFAL